MHLGLNNNIPKANTLVTLQFYHATLKLKIKYEMKVDIPQQIYFQTYWAAIIESRLLILLILFLNKSILIEFLLKC